MRINTIIYEVRTLLFGTMGNAAITVACALFLYWILPPLLSWLIIDATWDGIAQTCRRESGACWAFVREKFWFSIFGLYPSEQRWRPSIVLAIFGIVITLSAQERFWRRDLIFGWVAALIVIWLLMRGTVFGIGIRGLEPIPTRLWGGLIVTMILSVYGLVISFPVGIVLALGRRSKLPIIKGFCVAWIELVRGVPLISILFMSTFIVPLFFPPSFEIDRFLRAQIAFIIFAAAYIAEAVRGGLQAIPEGQYQAAEALGLSYAQRFRLVILPQALRLTIPAQVNILINLVKGTALVLIIGIFDFFTTLRAALGDSMWLGFASEIYVYAALVYFVFCYLMSQYSRRLEHRFSTGYERMAVRHRGIHTD